MSTGTTTLPARQRGGLFYGWWIVAVGVLLMATIFGTIVNAFSLFALPLNKDLPDITRAMFAIAYSFITLVAIPLSPIVGNLMKKWDARILITAGVVAAAVANIGLSFTMNVVWLYAMALVQGLAVTLATTIPLATVITNWFVKHRGTALGITMAGSGLGGLIFIPLIDGLLIPSFTWRGAYLTLAAIQLVLLVPLTLLVIRTRPEQKGLTALGAGEGQAAADAPTQQLYGLTQGETLKTPAFWLLGAALIFAGISVNGMISGFKPILVSLQAPEGIIVWILSFVGIFVMIGKFATGWLFDKLGLMAAIVLVSAANAAQFFFMLSPTTMLNAVAFNALHGFGATMVTVTPAYLAARLFGQKHYAENYGWVSAFAMAGAGLAPIVGAFFYGGRETSTTVHAHNLVWAWLVMGLIGLALYIVTVITKPRWEPEGYKASLH